MPERFAKIESSSLRELSLEERLKAYPELKAKIEAMLSIIENSGGDVEKAAEAMIEELRQMGNEVLHRWARRQQQKKEEEHNAQPGVNRQEKKALPSRTCGLILAREAVPAYDRARFPWLHRCGIRTNVWLSLEFCC